MAKIFVAGSGGWGTALAVMAANHGHEVSLWSAFEEEIRAICTAGEHTRLLPGVPVPPSVRLTTDLSGAAESDLLILAVPSFAIRETAKKLRAVLPDGHIIANAGKGLEDASHTRFSEVLREELPTARITVLSGPSHAEEVGRGVPTGVVCASSDREAAEQVRDWLSNNAFRMYTNDDVIGVELGGALKNVIALATGIVDGMGLGDNTKAMLMTRGLAEMARLGRAFGAKEATFAGLAGVGDLIVTCGSMHSRNRRAGILIGQGQSAADAIKIVGTVEGYHAARAADLLAKSVGVEMPITHACYRVCYEGMSAREALNELFSRPYRPEQDDCSWQ